MLLPWKRSRSDKIFINYRRDDAGGFAGRLSDSLAGYFGRDRVFRDVTDIGYGDDFEQAIDRKLSESGAVVVLIGDKWSSLTNREGKRRLDDPGDYVSREIVAALQSGVPVIPVLIGDADMPRKDELPEKLRALTLRNAMTITDERWELDMTRLAKVLAIDVPGSVAQRKLDALKVVALLLLFASVMFTTFAFCTAVSVAVSESVSAKTALAKAGFTPLASGIPFIATLLAGTLALVAVASMEESKRKFAWAATALAYIGTLASFVRYGMTNASDPTGSLVVNFAASTIITMGVLALMTMAAFRAK